MTAAARARRSRKRRAGIFIHELDPIIILVYTCHTVDSSYQRDGYYDSRTARRASARVMASASARFAPETRVPAPATAGARARASRLGRLPSRVSRLGRNMRTPPGSADARHRPRASAADAPGAAASGAPAMTDAERASLRDESLSWAAQHGLLVATEGAERGATMAAAFTHAPVSLLPTPFPRAAFERAVAVSPSFAELSDVVSRDHAFLETTLAGVLETDAFTRALWDVYVQSGAQAGRHACECGVLRSDYMLDAPSGAPLQVEVNTVSTSFMALGTRVQQMHRHVAEYFPSLKQLFVEV